MNYAAYQPVSPAACQLSRLSAQPPVSPTA